MWCHLSIYRKLNILLLGWTQNRYIIVGLIILLTFYSDDSFEISSSKKELPLRIPFEVFWTYYFDVYTIWFLSVVGVSWRRKLDPKLYIFCTASLNYENCSLCFQKFFTLGTQFLLWHFSSFSAIFFLVSNEINNFWRRTFWELLLIQSTANVTREAEAIILNCHSKSGYRFILF